MRAGANGLPDPAARLTFAAGAANPVDLEIGPEGDLFYADFDGGTVRRIRYFSANRPPVAVATANPTSGRGPARWSPSTAAARATPTPATRSPTPGISTRTVSSTTRPRRSRPGRTPQPGDYVVRLRVTDAAGASSVSAPLTITVGNNGAVGDDRRRRRRDDLAGRATSSPSPARRPTPSRARCRRAR